jgi:LmbE family N-acetylglucosaminyl deacetylase
MSVPACAILRWAPALIALTAVGACATGDERTPTAPLHTSVAAGTAGAAATGAGPATPDGNPNVDDLRVPKTSTSNTRVTEFYVHAHQDDWQLFMGDRVATSLTGSAKTVFVFLTAGDAAIPGTAYWRARENAAMAAYDAIAGKGGRWSCGTITLQARVLQRCTKQNSVSYFFRLPDGAQASNSALLGAMWRLRDGLQPSLGTVDNSTTYRSWDDLTQTLRAVILEEAADRSRTGVVVHSPEYDRTRLLTFSHEDHLATADAVRAAAGGDWGRHWYMDYSSALLPVNLTTDQIATKRSAFAAYSTTMVQAGYVSHFNDPEYQAWLQRTYARTEDAGVLSIDENGRGNGPGKPVGQRWTP